MRQGFIDITLDNGIADCPKSDIAFLPIGSPQTVSSNTAWMERRTSRCTE